MFLNDSYEGRFCRICVFGCSDVDAFIIVENIHILLLQKCLCSRNYVDQRVETPESRTSNYDFVFKLRDELSRLIALSALSYKAASLFLNSVGQGKNRSQRDRRDPHRTPESEWALL